MAKLLPDDIGKIAAEAIGHCAGTFSQEDVEAKMAALIGPVTDATILEYGRIWYRDLVADSIRRQINRKARLNAVDDHGRRDFFAWDDQVIRLGKSDDGISEYVHRKDATVRHLFIRREHQKESMDAAKARFDKDREDEQEVIDVMIKHDITWGEACRRLGMYGADAA
jgi:hypothetical protein